MKPAGPACGILLRVSSALLLIMGVACSEPGPAAPDRAEPRQDVINPSPLPQSVRFVWFVPADVAWDEATPAAIRRAALNAQSWFRALTGGLTFRFDEEFPVEVVFGEHARSWYQRTPNPWGWDPVWNANYWIDREVSGRQSFTDWSPLHKTAIYMSAAGGGGASGGRLTVPQHDVDGIQDGNLNINRFWGGLAHELGHAFDLPDAAGDDGTIMSAALYAYPAAALTAEQLAAMRTSARNAGYLVDLGPEFAADAWYLLINAANGRAVDLERVDTAAGIAAGIAVVAKPRTGAESQQWRLTARGDGSWAISNRATGRLLAVENRALGNEARITQQSDVDPRYQSWYVLATGAGEYEIVASYNVVPNQSVKSLDLASDAAGAPLVQRDYRALTRQAWRLERLDRPDRDARR